MESETSSIPQSKPSDCPTETWNELANIIRLVDQDENCQSQKADKKIILEITDIDDNGQIKVITTENSTVIELNPKNLTPLETVIAVTSEPSEQVNTNNTFPVNDGSEHFVGIEKGPEKILSRKRRKMPAEWKQNIRKNKRQKGEEYVNTKGNKQPAKKVKTETCRTKKCSFKCSKIISREEREYIHLQFWKLDDNGKIHFYSKHIGRIAPLRKRTKKNQSKKQYTYEYYFIVLGVKIRVCQEYFLNTLNISKNRIYYFFKKNKDEDFPNPLTQGKHTKKIIPEEKKDEVRAHIRSFPTVESHYCRANTKKVYLERGLNKKRMYDLYQESTVNLVKFHLYSQIFDTNFNIGFFKPKKDLCDKCAQFQLLTDPSPSEVLIQEKHINRKNIGKVERYRDRTKYVENEEIGVITFDLQNVFTLPKANISNFYYKTKLACYNLTAYLDKNKTVYNALWHQFLAGRAGIHIACGVIYILKQIMMDSPNLQKVILWSDSCIAQNKNSIMSLALQHFLRSEHSKGLKCIEQKFGEPGHGNVQEIDCAHSCIERHIKNLEIWSPISLVKSLMSIPTTWKFKFKILQMKETDYFDFQSIAKTLTYNTIPYTKVKHIIYKKDDLNTIEYKEAFDGGTVRTKIYLLKRQKLTKRKPANEHIFYDFLNKIPMAKKVVNISNLKREHLRQMQIYIPNEIEKIFYDVLLAIKNTPQTNTTEKNKTPKKPKKKVSVTSKTKHFQKS